MTRWGMVTEVSLIEKIAFDVLRRALIAFLWLRIGFWQVLIAWQSVEVWCLDQAEAVYCFFAGNNHE